MKIALLAALALLVPACLDPDDTLSTDEGAISGGTEAGKLFPAVGVIRTGIWNPGDPIPSLPGCSGTLIADDLVLTAAHCVCGKAYECGQASPGIFTLPDLPAVFTGTYTVHPDYLGFKELSLPIMSHDLAVLRLDTPVSSVANIAPMELVDFALDSDDGDLMTMVGYGYGNSDCDSGLGVKRYGNALLGDVRDDGLAGTKLILTNDLGAQVCGGDSGGPVLIGSKTLRIAGVASQRATVESIYQSTYHDRAWLAQQFVSPGNRFRMWSFTESVGLANRVDFADIDPNPYLIQLHDEGDLSSPAASTTPTFRKY